MPQGSQNAHAGNALRTMNRVRHITRYQDNSALRTHQEPSGRPHKRHTVPAPAASWQGPPRSSLAGQRLAQPGDRLAVQLTDPRPGHAQNRADLLEAQVFLLAETKQHALPLRQILYRGDQVLSAGLGKGGRKRGAARIHRGIGPAWMRSSSSTLGGRRIWSASACRRMMGIWICTDCIGGDVTTRAIGVEFAGQSHADVGQGIGAPISHGLQIAGDA